MTKRTHATLTQEPTIDLTATDDNEPRRYDIDLTDEPNEVAARPVPSQNQEDEDFTLEIDGGRERPNFRSDEDFDLELDDYDENVPIIRSNRHVLFSEELAHSSSSATSASTAFVDENADSQQTIPITPPQQQRERNMVISEREVLLEVGSPCPGLFIRICGAWAPENIDHMAMLKGVCERVKKVLLLSSPYCGNDEEDWRGRPKCPNCPEHRACDACFQAYSRVVVHFTYLLASSLNNSEQIDPLVPLNERFVITMVEEVFLTEDEEGEVERMYTSAQRGQELKNCTHLFL